MFDPQTTQLISQVPELPELDREHLAKTLSESFAKISSARIRLRSLEEAEADETLNAVVEEMRRLARTNEAFVSVNLDREDRSAAAFVAGTAHQLVFKAEQLQEREEESSRLTSNEISPDISTVLLFMIAEATADACEAADHLRLDDDDRMRRALIAAIRALARGNLQSIIEADNPELGYLDGQDIADIAVAALYRRILFGIQILARQLSGQLGHSAEDAYGLFMSIRDLCISDKIDVFEDGETDEVVAFAGPFHLATLMAALAKDLLDSSVVGIAPPEGLDGGQWHDSLRKVAAERPYLWRNHRQAIGEGYLEIGTSSVVGFPTGAGKSTLSELKINAAMLAGTKVVFLAPTLALVDQTATSLSKAFPAAEIGREQSDPFLAAFGGDEVAEILVLTPEACLAQMSFDQQEFANVGLVVFDECHLLHPSDRPEDRRPIDAMLCLLNLIRLADQIDVLLLSAMMKNTDELAAWVADLTGRPCLSLSLAWKPTRQIRGCVVYDEGDLSNLKARLRWLNEGAATRGVPSRAKQAVGAQCLGFFSLHQTWATRNANDYSLQPLLDEEVLLGVNAGWRLTPNSGEVSAAIGSKSAQMGVKTLIFFQTIKNANSAANKVNGRLEKTKIELTPNEASLHRAAVQEFGDSDCLYLVSKDGIVETRASIHHGLLLPEERRLVESLYKRPNGLSVLCATSTLAQGMNLPSEMVIIAEDSRFDEALKKREVLEAQELLNAAGRAGRAGMIANGMVLVVPGRVVGINIGEKTIGQHWTTLLSIFGQSDQCLDIDDPLMDVMDRIHEGADQEDELAKYCISRLVSSGGSDSASGLDQVVAHSLSGFRARRDGDGDWVAERVAAVTNFATEAGLTSDVELDAVQNVAALFGFPISVVTSLEAFLSDRTDIGSSDIQMWSDLLFGWLSQDTAAFTASFRAENLNRLFGKKFEMTEDHEARRNFAVPKLQELTNLWIAGHPLKTLEGAFHGRANGLGKCMAARRFALRCIPDLSYAFSLPAKLLEYQQAKAEKPEEIPPVIANLSRCIRAGFNNLEVLALQQCLNQRAFTRRQIYQQFEELLPHLKRSDPDEDYDIIMHRVETALEAQAIADLI
ncbi:ski2-like helicase [Roseovarius albus]|uniref:Ski2-like helicase n=1 Tax=Roseovarius albus TaxID=1247867 RepID=A0A1X6ZXN9_9RHOB|nr:DEAD/DEAH box helicase [Roseovarius albus]SLN64593.1 ski2-like helicase [Roseovarius albus]